MAFWIVAIKELLAENKSIEKYRVVGAVRKAFDKWGKIAEISGLENEKIKSIVFCMHDFNKLLPCSHQTYPQFPTAHSLSVSFIFFISLIILMDTVKFN